MAEGKARKEQTQKLLATVVMGMSLVNTVAPMAAAAQAEPLPQLPRPAAGEARPLDYAVLPQVLDYLDRAVFATAEAEELAGSGNFSSMGSGDIQNISSGQSGTVGVMNGGSQVIYSGGTGSAGVINSGGTQSIRGGIGTANIISNGAQYISSGGSGTVNTLESGTQYIRRGCSGTIITMNSGGQTVGDIGMVSTMNSGSQMIYSGGSGTVSVMNGGTQRIIVGSGTVSAMNGGTQVIERSGISLNTVLNSGGTIYQNSGGVVTSVTYNGGVHIIDGIVDGYDNRTLGAGGTNVTMGVISGGQMSSTVLNSGGMQLVLEGGSALATKVSGGTVYLASGGLVSGLTMSGGILELENVSGGSFAIYDEMTANSATINMLDGGVTQGRSAAPAYESLTIANLKGSGNTFIMDTDLAGGKGDKVTITSAAAGSHYVQIRDLSKLNSIEVTGAHKLLLITDESNSLTFAGQELNLGGLFDLEPTLTNGGELGLSSKDWYLTKIAKTANNDTKVLLFDADNSYALWRNTNDSLRSRLGELHGNAEHDNGVWARTQAGRFRGFGYEGRYNLYQLGYDKTLADQSVYGLAVEYGDGTGSYTNGSSKDKLTAFSLYGVWQGKRGAYTNVTARAGMFDTDLKSYGDFPDKASYKEHAYSISVEYGQRFDYQQGLFFEPQAQFTLGHLSGISYTTDRGANGYIEGLNSAIGRIGFIMGQKVKNGSDIYLKADLLHEFAGKRDLQLTSDAGGTNDILSKHNDYGDTWFELGLGANIKLSKDSSFYGEVERGFGGDINKKWSVNAGLRFTF